MRFRNRKEAGEKLADLLLKYKGKDVVVYALPRGGVPVGYEVAEKLGAPLEVTVVRKVGHPSQPEYAICAVAEDGHMLCNEDEVAAIEPRWLRTAIEEGQQEAVRRRALYGGGKKMLSPEGKVAIIVDDGIATGLTMLVAIDEIAHRHPKKIVVAVPVTPKEAAEEIKKKGVTLVALHTPEIYEGAVGAYYEEFPQIANTEVTDLLKKCNAL